MWESIAKIGEAAAVWLNPERREKAVLRKALEAAEQLLMILRKEGIYSKLPQTRIKKLELHYQKQFDSWKDGV